MDPSTNLKTVFSKMGVELRRVETKVGTVDEKLKLALSVCMSLVDCVDAVKEQLERVRESWKFLKGNGGVLR